LPVLEEFGVPATVFVASGFIGSGKIPWPERVAMLLADTRLERLTIGREAHELSSPARRTGAYMALTRLLKSRSAAGIDEEIAAIRSGSGLDTLPEDSPFADDFRPLTDDEFTRLADHGLISIGCHTINHYRLSQLPAKQATAEIIDAKRDLECRAGEVDYFAYPYGGFGADFDDSHVATVRNGGYRGAFAIGAGGAARGCDPYLIPRINVTSNVGLPSLDYLVSGGGSLAGAASTLSVALGLLTGTVKQGSIQ
jgi:peptidoglycan/xylan/chitin deacetylase (PgdA/CDA1 family)